MVGVSLAFKNLNLMKLRKILKLVSIIWIRGGHNQEVDILDENNICKSTCSTCLKPGFLSSFMPFGP